jgi:Cas7 group CRISPR-associated protein Csh2
MDTLNNKIDFAVIVCVNNANPNGDPLNGNRPRVTFDGFGELSDVSIKRKIRNRLMGEGHSIFVQSDDNRVDDYRSLRSRAEGALKKVNMNARNGWMSVLSASFLPIRAAGMTQVFLSAFAAPFRFTRPFQSLLSLIVFRAFRLPKASAVKAMDQNAGLTPWV